MGFALIRLCVINVRFSRPHIRARGNGRLAPQLWPAGIFGVQPAAREADRCS